MGLHPRVRRGFMAGLAERDLQQLLLAAEAEAGTPYHLWFDDPVGFVYDVLGETLWSKSKELLAAIPGSKKVLVPSCFGSSKTFSAARSLLWFIYTRPVGVAKVVTIAPLWRQVLRQLWPEIRAAHSRASLPGTVDQAQLKLRDRDGLEQVVAYGIAASPYNEASVQGIHFPNLLLVVDEAGGLGHVIGRNLAGLLVGEGARMLAIGNPPTDDEGSWFEQECARAGATVIPIRAADTPNLSGEAAPTCRTCPPEVPEHSLATHLVDQDWVADTIGQHGADSPYVQAKVFARFPRGGPNRAIPSTWVELARDVEEPDPDGHVRLCDLGVAEEQEQWLVRPGAWVRLGVDVAADGGDELAISRCVGDLVTMRHTSAGAANTNAVTVAGVVLAEIRRAEAVAAGLGSTVPVRVKVDAIGVGWGVAGILEAWGSEGLHGAEIVKVVVSEATGRGDPENSTLRPYRKRDEMWLAGRALTQPGPDWQPGRLRLRIDQRTAAQLSTPTYGTNSGGFTVIEGKASLKRRGLPSPDRAESVLLAVYEPLIGPKRKKARLIV
jgi:hypothetical protein